MSENAWWETQLARTTPTLPSFFFFLPFFSSPHSFNLSRALCISLSLAPHSSPAAPVTLQLWRPPLSGDPPSHLLLQAAYILYIYKTELVSIVSLISFSVFLVVFLLLIYYKLYIILSVLNFFLFHL
jgi:hypothetical protein